MTPPGEVAGESNARPEWTRRNERGSVLLVRLMTWISLRLGRRAGRCLLPLICAYFLLTGAHARRASRIYLRRVLGHEPGWLDLYRHVHCFASTIHDRIYLINDRFDLFDIEIRGGELVTDLLAKGHGALLMGAHFGSFEVLRSLAHGKLMQDVAMVMYEENARKVAAALAAANPAARLDIITLGQAGSMLQIRQRLVDGAIVGILGDRMLGGDATIAISFLGAPTALPAGPFRLAAMLRHPVIFMAGVYLGGNRYRIHFEPLADFSMMQAGGRGADLQAAVERFAALLEEECRAMPYNWFNFFDFWQPPPPVTGTARTSPP